MKFPLTPQIQDTQTTFWNPTSHPKTLFGLCNFLRQQLFAKNSSIGGLARLGSLWLTKTTPHTSQSNTFVVTTQNMSTVFHCLEFLSDSLPCSPQSFHLVYESSATMLTNFIAFTFSLTY